MTQRLVLGLLLGVLPWASALAVDAFDTVPFRDDRVVEILTLDETGAERRTKVWSVVVDAAVFVRTNDSRWLANIRRGSPVQLLARDLATPVRAEEVVDSASREQVEAAFRAKYGRIQRLMSALRLREPTVLRLTPLGAGDPGG